MRKNRNVMRAAIILLFLLAIAGNIYFYHKYQKAQDNNPQVQTQKIVDQLRKTTALPNETPSVMTVVDKSKLSNQALAQVTQDGDKILLYPNAGKVIVYRPSTHQLISIFNLDTSSTSSTSSTQTPAATTPSTPTGTSMSSSAKR